MVASSGSEFCISADGWNEWCSLFIPHDAVENETPDMDQEPLSGCRVVPIGSRQLRQVRRAVRTAIKLASRDVSLHPAQTHTETTLHDFAKSAITQNPTRGHSGRGRPRVDRHGVVRLVADSVTAESNQGDYVRVLADAAEISERTLLRIFHDWFGISPVRYARLRQVHAVRDALLAADPNSTTVTSVLIQHDIHQFGRFAGLYRSLFGELPSETLSRSNR